MRTDIGTMLKELARTTRDETLDAAAELCDVYAESGHDAACCARALRDLKAKLTPPPSKQT